ncbi:MAG: protein kinase, partial [Acidobacteriota bacterium]
MSETVHATDSGGRFSVGDVLAERFEITRWIANGGMGEVYAARDLELGTEIALKIIRPRIARDKAAMLRFRREITLSHRVTHPNVCRIYDFFQHTAEKSEGAKDEDVVFLTMELLQGRTLDDCVPDGQRLGLARISEIARQIADALGAAHGVGIVHRDLKCSNVMVVEADQKLRVVVTDFGLACHEVDDDVEVTRVGEVIGSPAYMAPEQATQDAITPASDLYAFGVLLYRLVTGRLPFESRKPFVLIANKLKGDPLPPRAHVPDLDPRWDDAIMRCLDRSPDERPASAAEVIAILEGDVAKVEGPGKGDKARGDRDGVIRRARLATLAAAVAVVVLGFSTWTARGPKAHPFLASAAAGFPTPADSEVAALYVQGLDSYSTGEMQAARRLLNKAASSAPDDPLVQAALAKVERALGYDGDALGHIRVAYQARAGLAGPERLLVEGDYRRFTGDFDGAIGRYERLLEHFPGDLGLAVALGEIQVEAGRLQDAEQTYAQLMALPEEARMDPRVDLFAAKLAKAGSQLLESSAAASRAIEASERLGRAELALRAKQLKARVLCQLGEITEARDIVTQAYHDAVELGDKYGMAEMLGMSGIIDSYRDDLEEALVSYGKALSLYREIDNRQGILRVLNNKTNVLTRLGRHEESLVLRREAVDLARSMGRKKMVATSVSNLAVTLWYLGEMERTR